MLTREFYRFGVRGTVAVVTGKILISGRPIVKGGKSNNTNSTQFQYTGNAEFQQPQQHRTASNVYGNPARSKHTMATSLPHHNVSQYNVPQTSMMNQRTNSINTQMKSQPQVPSHLAGMQQQQPSPHAAASMQQQPPPQRTAVNTQLATKMQLVVNQNYNSNRTGNDSSGRIQFQYLTVSFDSSTKHLTVS